MKKLFKNVNLVTGVTDDPYIENGYLLVEDDVIAAIGSGELPEADQTVDLHGAFIMPGMISTHYHFYGQFARGMSVYKPVKNWQQVLANMWWDMDRMLDEDANYYSAMMGLTEGLKYGLTTYFDHQASPSCIDGCLDTLEDAFKVTGARGALAYEVTDRNGKEGALAGINENVRFIKKHADDNGKLKGLFGLHASYTLCDETLEKCAADGNAIGAGFHTHLAEDKADVCDCYQKYDKHPVERMRDMGILSDKTICAHVVHVTPEHYEILRDTGVTVAHNVQSNTNNAVGICPADPMMRAGVHVAVGGDGFFYNPYMELIFAGMQQHIGQGSCAAFGGDSMMRLAFENPARLAKNTFGYEVGQLKSGAKADFVISEFVPPTPVTPGNAMSHMLWGMGDHIRDVYVGGEKVVEDGKLVSIDEKEVFAKTREAAARVWKKMETA